MTESLTIPGRFNGPPGSANGGIACGLVAGLLQAEVVEVTLRTPPPLETPLTVSREAGGVRVADRERLVAEARTVESDLGIGRPPAVSLEEASEAAQRYAGFERHAYPTCFVCGPRRDDGLGIYPGRVEDGVVAAPWTPPPDLSRELVWAALDCPSGWAVDDFQREGVLLGRLAARVDALPAPGEPHIVVGWRLALDGRKRHAASAILTSDGAALALARSTWIVPSS